eukprot:scaffold79463_cov26-Tisochrysis_lutea.AAC.1
MYGCLTCSPTSSDERRTAWPVSGEALGPSSPRTARVPRPLRIRLFTSTDIPCPWSDTPVHSLEGSRPTSSAGSFLAQLALPCPPCLSAVHVKSD